MSCISLFRRYALASAVAALSCSSGYAADEVITIIGPKICGAPGNEAILDGTEVTCQCQSGMEEIGSFGPPEDNPDGPSEKMCGLNLADDVDLDREPDRPLPGGGGGRDDPDEEPEVCPPDELDAQFERLSSTYGQCLERAGNVASGMFFAGTTAATAGLVFANPTAGSIGLASLFGGIVNYGIASDSCNEQFCNGAKAAVVGCGYPVAIYTGSSSASVCRFYP